MLPAAALDAGGEAGGPRGAAGGHGVGGAAVSTGTTGGPGLDAEGALALIRQYLREKRPGDTVRVAPLSGDASTRRYYRVVDGGRSFVLALYPEPFVAEELSYLTVHGLLEGYGLPVPATIDVDGARGIVLQEDLGDRTLQVVLEGAGEGERGELYREAVDEVAQLQMRAAQGPQKLDCFRIAFDIEKLSWELHYFLKHFLEAAPGLRPHGGGPGDALRRPSTS